MFYEFNLQEDFNDPHILDSYNYSGICISKVFNPTDKITTFPQFNIKTSIYKKLTINLTLESIKSTFKTPQFDIKCISCDTQEIFEYVCEKFETDLIKLPLNTILFPIKQTTIRKAIERKIFFEICLKDSFYCDKVFFLRNVQTLLCTTKGKNLILSSGAQCESELRDLSDYFRFLGLFETKKSWLRRIESNPTEFLSIVAGKRFLYKGCLGDDEENGDLKRDFIIKRFEGI